MNLRFWTFLWLVVGGCAMTAQSPNLATVMVSVRGKLVQDSSYAPVGFGTVYLTPIKKEMPTSATVADENGFWSIHAVMPGNYRLEVSCLGFKSFVIDRLSVDSFSNFLLLRDIVLKPEPKILEPVEVIASKQAVQFGTEKQVYHVEKQMLTLGGTLADVLNDIPAIQVETNGVIRLRGSEQTVLMVNGVPVGSSANIQSGLLQSLNATAIQSIEVILNPDVSYSAEGNAGIININTKKNDQAGFNVTFEANAGSGRNALAALWTPRSELSLGFNWRKSNWNAYIMGSSNSRQAWRTVTAFRTNTEQDSLWDESIFSLANSHQRNYFLQSGLDYRFKGGWSMQHQLQWMNRNNKIYDETINDFLPDKIYRFRSFRKEDVLEYQPLTEYTGKLKKVFQDDQQHFLEVTLSATNLKIEELNHLSEAVVDISGPERTQQSQKEFKNQYFLSQIVYKNPFKNGMLWEVGSVWSHRNDEDQYNVKSVDPATGEWIVNTRQTNHFLYHEALAAGFTSLSGKWKQFNYQLGYRLEYARISARQIFSGKYFPYSYLKGYPGFNVSYPMGTKDQLQFITTRRVSRPSYQLLDPFTDYADTLNIKRGNPELVPEFTWNFEIGYQHTAKWGSIHASIYLKETREYLSRYLEMAPFSRSLIYSYRNIDRSHYWGGEINSNVQICPWWKITASLSGFHQHFFESEEPGVIESSGLGWFSRLQQQWSLPYSIELQYAMMYRSNSPMFQGFSFYNWTMDLGLRKSIANGKGAFTLKISDPFNTLNYGFFAADELFSLNRSIKRESRTLMLGFKYALSQEKMNKPEKEPKSTELNTLESY